MFKKYFYFPSFTLLELLLVIGILGVLASISFVALNPQEQIKKSRDSRRLADLKSLDNAVSIYESQSTNSVTGSSTKIYLSLPDTSSTCTSYSLSPAPSGYSYACVTQADLYKTDGTGWVPVNFQSLAIGSPISRLPTDPLNNQTFYYTYVTGGSYQLTALIESNNNKISEVAINDGGRMPGVFEVGTDLGLGPFTRDNGLVGYWAFDEGSGITAYDYSGQGNNRTLVGSPTWEVSANCRNKGMCISFSINNVAQYANAGDPASGILDFSALDSFSFSIWLNISQMESSFDLFWKGGWSGVGGAGYRVVLNTSGQPSCYYADGDTSGAETASTATVVYDSSWHLITCVMDRSSGKFSIYVDGIYKSADTNLTEGSAKSNTSSSFVGESSASYEVNGFIDDVRIYNRALSVDEIRAIYGATK